MIFGIESYRTAYGRNGMICVFKLLDSDIDPHRIQKAYGGLPQLALKEMIERGFADTALFGKLRYGKALFEIVGYKFNSSLQSLI